MKKYLPKAIPQKLVTFQLNDENLNLSFDHTLKFALTHNAIFEILSLFNMAGIYLHIPFCKQACHYCNFHFSTSLKKKDQLLEALLKEIAIQKDFLRDQKVQTIYLGGGTPSILSGEELEQIFHTLYDHFPIASTAEITLEANPDDLSEEKVTELKQLPINRLSIGIQSFDQTDLQWMNRAHNDREAFDCIDRVLAAGFHNLTVDLIYGIPSSSHDIWAKNVQTVLDFQIPHLSCYCLTVEPQTALAHQVKMGKKAPVDDEKATEQFHYLITTLENANYEHYEISNFAKPGFHSQHNSSYWNRVPYLGLGPSAHSFNGIERQWNVANNLQYIKCIQNQETWFEKEFITKLDQYNEYILTRLRTSWGCDLKDINPMYQSYFLKQIAPFIEQGLVKSHQDNYTLLPSGKILADHITQTLFKID